MNIKHSVDKIIIEYYRYDQHYLEGRNPPEIK